MPGFTLSSLGLLLLLASLAAMLSRRAKLPYRVALVAAGAGPMGRLQSSAALTGQS